MAKRIDWVSVGYMSIPVTMMALMILAILLFCGCEVDSGVYRKGEVPDGVPERCWRLTDLQLRRNCQELSVTTEDGGTDR